MTCGKTDATCPAPWVSLPFDELRAQWIEVLKEARFVDAEKDFDGLVRAVKASMPCYYEWGAEDAEMEGNGTDCGDCPSCAAREKIASA